MKTKQILIPLLSIFVITGMSSCRKKGCTDSAATNYDQNAKKDDGSCTYDNTPATYQVSFKFTQNYGGTNVTSSDFNALNFTNDAGTTHSITKMRYLISKIRLYTATGDSVSVPGYRLVDMTDNNTLTFSPGTTVEGQNFTGIAFNFGFDSIDNVTGAYADLNLATWGWPSMLGGGYHYMQFEGNFIDSIADTLGFAYHMGTAREITSVDTIYHNNHFMVQLANSGFTLSNNATIEIKMDIAEWFKNPYSWNLNTYYNALMPNYNAQILMNQNGRSVFSLGTITQ